ncbi:molybdenum cofactor guanylyltransferase [Devosia submarina]|uniref:molybdenum cofactor guanylyltransferase n=1 Tax=Devosia submarina TaxID=1173082 RepID=UPI000D368448|nr:molybdenum cofactor guanylyltransferase [Devosia submarina]
MNPIHAVVLAGGEGRRLGGVRKADLRVGGVPLIERVARVLGGVEHPLLISTGPLGREWDFPSGRVGVSDLAGSGGGPLAGVVAAVAALQSRGIIEGSLVSVAVDTPFLPNDFVQRLVEELGPAPAAYASWNEAFYPTNAIWRLEAIGALPEQTREIGSLKFLLTSLDAKRVAWDELPEDPFANINTPQDLLAMETRAKRQVDL